MKSLLSFVLFSSLILVCYSAVFLERQRTVPGHEKLCYDKADGIFYKKGEEMKWKLKGCGRKICMGSTGKGDTYAEIQTCGKIYLPPKCHFEADLSLAYPYCCEQVICPEMYHSNANFKKNFPLTQI